MPVFRSVARLTSLVCLAALLTVPGLVRSDTSPGPDPQIQRVESKYVCMVNDRYFEGIQIPVQVGDKTYYGCCRNCIGTLKNNARIRHAVDPISGTVVDKAVAVIGVMPDGTVRYFENEQHLQALAGQMGSRQ